MLLCFRELSKLVYPAKSEHQHEKYMQALYWTVTTFFINDNVHICFDSDQISCNILFDHLDCHQAWCNAILVLTKKKEIRVLSTIDRQICTNRRIRWISPSPCETARESAFCRVVAKQSRSWVFIKPHSANLMGIVSNWLTHFCPSYALIDVTLAVKDANSKLVAAVVIEGSADDQTWNLSLPVTPLAALV